MAGHKPGTTAARTEAPACRWVACGRVQTGLRGRAEMFGQPVDLLDVEHRIALQEMNGSLDLIARDGPVVVFVEVKTRTQSAFGRPSEAVTAVKRGRIARVASLFLARSGWDEKACRFDVVEVVPDGSGWRVTHLADAFRQGD